MKLKDGIRYCEDCDVAYMDDCDCKKKIATNITETIIVECPLCSYDIVATDIDSENIDAGKRTIKCLDCSGKVEIPKHDKLENILFRKY